MISRLLPCFLSAILWLAAGGIGRATEAWLRVTWAEKSVVLSEAEWAKLPRTEVTSADPHTKTEHRYAGVAMREVLHLVQAPTDKDLRGAAQRLAVLVRGRDGYAVLFALAEFDPAFSARTILLADRIDGLPLPEKAAPLQVIAPGDRRGARWARMVTAIEIVSVPAGVGAGKP